MENSPEQERALFLDYLTTMWNLFGQTGLLSAKKSLYRAAEKFNEPISDIVEEQVIEDYEKERFGISSPRRRSPVAYARRRRRSTTLPTSRCKPAKPVDEGAAIRGAGGARKDAERRDNEKILMPLGPTAKTQVKSSIKTPEDLIDFLDRAKKAQDFAKAHETEGYKAARRARNMAKYRAYVKSGRKKWPDFEK